MQKIYILIVIICLQQLSSFAQTPVFPYIESFDSFPVNQALNGDGGIIASAHVYVAPYGVVGNCAGFQMSDTATALTDTITSPLIGPLTAHTVTSFYFRAVTVNAGVVSHYQMTSSDSVVIYVGTANMTIAVRQYVIDSLDQDTSLSYRKVTIGSSIFLNGLNGHFRIVVYNPQRHDWQMEFDSLVVKDTVVIVIPPVLTDSVTSVRCRGENTGGIKVIASGASPPYHYLWSTGDTTSAIDSLYAGIYSVTVTDSLGATATLSGAVPEPAYALVLDSLTKTPAKCYGSSTGTATVYSFGGTTPIHYLWNDALHSTTESANDLHAGNYDVTVTDAMGCSLTATVNISQSGSQLVTHTTSTSSSGSNGTASVAASGGAGAFTYQWSTGAIQTTSISGLAIGTYFVTVTDANGCEVIDTIVVTHPLGLSAINTNGVTIYPNPATDHIVISLGDNNESDRGISIFDITGRLIISTSSLDRIDVSHLPNGLYLVRVDLADGVLSQRLVIAR